MRRKGKPYFNGECRALQTKEAVGSFVQALPTMDGDT
jgi:hypothetical protein